MKQNELQSGTYACVIAAYRSPFDDPIRLRPGAALTITPRQSEWAGWLWCTDRYGKSGWVPERYIERCGPDAGVAGREYDATELSLAAGQTVRLGVFESGWYWCTDEQGRQGWLPAEHLAPGPCSASPETGSPAVKAG